MLTPDVRSSIIRRIHQLENRNYTENQRIRNVPDADSYELEQLREELAEDDKAN